MPEKLSRRDYEIIIQGQSEGKFTLMIDTAAWRDFLCHVDPQKLNPLLSRPVSNQLTLIRILSRSDILLIFACAGLSIPAFGWWAAALGPLLIFAGLFYKSRASMGRQSILGVTILLALTILACIFLETWTVPIKVFIISVTIVLFLIRFLYVFTSRFVFDNIHSSYDFFSKFYLEQAEKIGEVVIPFIWTSPEYAPESEDVPESRGGEGDGFIF